MKIYFYLIDQCVQKPSIHTVVQKWETNLTYLKFIPHDLKIANKMTDRKFINTAIIKRYAIF